MAISTYRPASTVQAGQIRYNTPQQAQQAYNKVSSAQPGQMQTYNPAVQNGQKTNLSGLFGSIGQKPAQFYSMGQLQPLMDQQRTAGMSTLNGPRTFQLGDALSAMQRASQTGQAVAMPNQRPA
jgi:hypothetical protein